MKLKGIPVNPTGIEVANYLAAQGITFKAEGGHRTERKSGDDKPWQCFEWRCEFSRPNFKPIRQSYYCGLAHVFESTSKLANPMPQPPSAASVLHGMLLDGEAAHNSFNDWCDNYGANNDSISAFNTYQECAKIGAELRRFFSVEQRAHLKGLLEEY